MVKLQLEAPAFSVCGVLGLEWLLKPTSQPADRNKGHLGWLRLTSIYVSRLPPASFSLRFSLSFSLSPSDPFHVRGVPASTRTDFREASKKQKFNPIKFNLDGRRGIIKPSLNGKSKTSLSLLLQSFSALEAYSYPPSLLLRLFHVTRNKHSLTLAWFGRRRKEGGKVCRPTEEMS